MKKLKIFEAFAGYGGGSFALKKINIDFECVGYSEINKNAIKCYEQNHPNTKNFGDINKIDSKEIPDFDLFLGGFPCQDVSLAGKRDLTKGRTNLYKECLRICKDKQPKYILLENVAGLLSMGKERKLINIIVSDLENIGYRVCWKKLNSKDFGIPQSRDRVWIVCFRDDIYEPFKFSFPQEESLSIKLKDILETNPDKKYFISNSKYEFIKRNKVKIDSDRNYALCLNNQFWKQGKQEYMNLITHSLMPRSSKTNKGGSGHLCKQDNTSYCLDTGNNQAIEYKEVFRRLTPKECFRLQGFLNDEIKLEELSDTAKYSLAGNGWEINLASKVLKNMLKAFNTSPKNQEQKSTIKDGVQ